MRKIKLTNGGFAKVDDIDFARVNALEWFWSNQGPSYSRRPCVSMTYKSAASIGEKRMRPKLHRFILNAPKGVVVDHKNGDPFDNRRSNLRLCSQQENCRNRTIVSRNNKSGVIGVFWKNQNKRWVARVIVNGRRKDRFFVKKSEAVEARKKMALTHYGEFAPQ